MSYFAAILLMEKPDLNMTYRPQHLEYLEKLESEGKVFAKGPFVDGAGGLVIYQANSIEEARELAEADPYIIHGVRSLQLHEWGMALSK
ncbi:YciI family protein [Alkalihalobacillus sp. MEB130]|uniref:YciI family protein n=1 Tax=Alkalihalobacillus sp. MEB130 TaxID=2976704 RepID=UPI0028DF431E|nr:YciI family protein [Alkalihalobacillus sp. MEB130]MDT8860669.1 YciI family protein [Alkalihalobacillus sp. MEB130]